VLPDAVSGQISIWSGAIVNIPTGWALCDGTQGTPNLRQKMIVGAGGTYPPDALGGSAFHTQTFTTDGHNHPIYPTDPINISGQTLTRDHQPATDSGTTDIANQTPPYFALAYIMYL